MPGCTCPLDAWPAPPDAPDRRFVFTPTKSYSGAVPIKLPCGKCVGCKLARAGDFAVRAVHEAHMHELEGLGSSFITFTFEDAQLPRDRSLSVEFIQAFHKRLRHVIGPFRFMLSGEYSDPPALRPHYHAVYFGVDFREDRYLWKRSSGGLLYRCPTLESVWTYGHCLIADFTRETGGYTARYTTKKAAGGEDDAAYCRVDPATGELWQVRPEFLLTSRSPGLGRSWFDRYKAEVFPCDFLVVDGRKVPVPRYYLNLLEEEERAAVQAERKRAGLAQRLRFIDHGEMAQLSRDERAERLRGLRRLGTMAPGDNSPSRLLVKHELQQLRARQLVRELDGEL